jgi:carbamate kinase
LPLDWRAAQTAGLVGHLLARELRNALPDARVLSLLVEAAVPRIGDAGAAGESAPCRIVELPLLRELADRDDRVMCVGSVPVQLDPQALLTGSGARLDHDQVAAALGIELRADILLLLTDEAAVYADWPARRMPLARVAAQRPLPAGLDAATIGGKLQAACRFARTPGTFAVIGDACEAVALVAGSAGTCVSLAP